MLTKVLVVLLCAACGAPVAQPDPATSSWETSSPAAVRAAPPVAVPVLAEGDRYAAAIDSAHRHGVRVWVEADLLARWLEGPAAFRKALDRVAALAQRPGVAGIKVADELGYRDGVAERPDLARRFLIETRAALRARVPKALLLVDLIVPELGCGPRLGAAAARNACTLKARLRDPAVTLKEVEALLATRAVDVLDLSTGLLADSHYRSRGLDRDQAQQAAWEEVRRRGWQQLVQLRARKALAHPGRYEGTADQAEADLLTWIDIPRAHGAAAVDVWTWRQSYRGEVVRLMDPGLLPNLLYEGLLRRRAAGATLSTHLTPSSLEHGLEVDMTALARVFTEVLVAAGTG